MGGRAGGRDNILATSQRRSRKGRLHSAVGEPTSKPGPARPRQEQVGWLVALRTLAVGDLEGVGVAAMVVGCGIGGARTFSV